MWFTETPWPPIIALSVLSLLGFAYWMTRRSTWILIASIACLLGCVAVYFIEKAIVTESERIEADIHQIVQACVDNDVEKVLSFFGPQEMKLRAIAQGGLQLVDIENDARVSDLDIKMQMKNTRADSHFRMNATIRVKLFDHHGRHPSRWLFTWQKFNDEWKVIEIKRLNPIDGREMQVLDYSE